MPALPEQIVNAIVATYHEALTPRELDVLRRMVFGMTNQEIADDLVIGLTSVKTHVDRVLSKFGARSRGQAVYIGLVLGLVRLSDENATGALIALTVVRHHVDALMEEYLGRGKAS